MSTSSGTWFSEKMTTTEMLAEIINDILNEPERLYQVLNGCSDFVNTSMATSCRLVTCGPPAAEIGLLNALQSDTKAEITLHEDVPPIPSPLRLNQTSRTSKKQKLAIVGMAGRFPNAADHEKFWDLLYAGLDVHREVSSTHLDASCLTCLTGHRFHQIVLMSRNITMRMARFATQAILLSDVSSTNLASLIPASSTCRLEKPHRRTRCIDWAWLVHMKLLKWPDMCPTVHHRQN